MKPVVSIPSQDPTLRPGAAPGGSKRRKGEALLGACVRVLMAVAILGCGGGDERGNGIGPRILIIGIDGASPRITLPMLEAGKLPHLAQLADDGVSGPLRSVLPLYSPRIWNTIASGRTANDHGILAFVKPGGEDRKELYLSVDRRTPALWNILSSAGRSVGVVNWWTTYPPEKINGVMVSDHFFPEQISMLKKTFKAQDPSDGALVHPESWAPRAREALADPLPLTEFENFFESDETMPRWVSRPTLSQQYITDQEITRVALKLQADHHPDVLMVFLPGIDRVSHWLWGNLEPSNLYPPGLQPGPEAKSAGAALLRRYYAYTDALIGLLVADYEPEDFVFVLSDHGFEAGVSLMLLTGKHDTPAALDGVLFARGQGIPRGMPAGPVNVYQFAPSVLALAGLPVADDMLGGPAGFVEHLGAEKIASYDTLEIERYAPAPSGNEEDIIEHLRALGYLEEEAPPETASERASPKTP